jgi:hypothetical protein
VQDRPRCGGKLSKPGIDGSADVGSHLYLAHYTELLYHMQGYREKGGNGS